MNYDVDERTVGLVLAEKAGRIGHRPFLHWAGRTYTYGDLDAMSNRYANSFRGLGIGRGSHVSMIMENGPEFFWTLFGLGKLGAVAVPLNTAARGDLLTYFLTQSDSTHVCVSEAFRERVTAGARQSPSVQAVLTLGAPAVAAGDDGDDGPAIVAMEGFGDNPATAPDVSPPVKASDPHLIMYTSGTTGPSKGAICPHSQGLSVGQQMADVNGYRPDDILYTCLPVFHANALWYTVYAALWAEASIALYPRFSARSFWDEVRYSGATIINCLGAMANILWQLPVSPHDRDHSVRVCMMVPNSLELSDGFRDRFGITTTSVYAMTENCAVTIFSPDDPRGKVPSAGRLRDQVSVQIVDDEEREVPPGEVGEIRIRPNERGIIMHGYYKMGDATVDNIRDLWFHTGDRGRVDSDGYLYFVDRKKEIIRRRGENISAFEVEMIICRHPAILEAAAVPVPSDLSEDDLMVYLVRAPDAFVEFEELIDFCATNMPYYMVPRYLDFIDELPKTPSEKIEKYRLKAAAAENLDRLWDREAAGITIAR
jgi:crotonobetaine/carnitine-CoA ligase